MSDEANPYRFTGDASELSVERPTRPADPLKRLRKVARLRTAFMATLFVHCAGIAGTLICFAVSEAAGLSYVPNAIANAAFVAMTCAYGGYAALLLVGVTLVPLGCPRVGPVLTLALVLPLANVGVGLFVARDSRRLLEARGVRVGWLRSDYSDAVDEESAPASGGES